MLSILASYAQEESRSVSENCKWRIKKMFEKGIPNGDNMLGYRLIDGTYHIVPEEAETIKTIFNDFLSGVGRMAIVKKLTESGAKTRRGGNWCENGIMRILKNEKYTGDMLLQKTYIADHISKESRYNKGERLMYLIGNSHEAIIDKDIFQAVQREIAARAARYHPSKAAPKSYPFTGKIICGLCGNRYRRKIAGAGGKYQKAVWICDTFNRHGKAACSSKQIPEDILLSTTAAALGLTEFSADIFKARVSEIRVTGANQLLFIFHDGTQTETTWADRSRRDSWNDEMKQTARARQYEMMKGRANK